ncbi:MAG: hypothetical protein Kow0069_09300 [Promethearchaeota archaeon]
MADARDARGGSPEKPDPWDQVGFHRPLAGFWFKLVLEVGVILIPVALVTFMLKYVYPFPTSIGYRTTFTGLFVLVFAAFDVGTANTISRFVADVNVKDPRRVVGYVQYFIWYQMFTGLLQVTLVSAWALYVVPVGQAEIAYGTYMMLAVVVKQWPGFPGVFKGTLAALQRFNKASTVDFVQGEAIQRFTEIGFVLLGKWWGASDPRVGELLGIAIGSAVGLYVDDVIAAVLAGWYLAKAMAPFGVEFRDLFRADRVDRKMVVECLSFGVRSGLPGIVYSGTKLFSLLLLLSHVPQYTTFVVLQDMAYQLVAAVQRLVYQDFTPLFAEAYQNGKVRLCQYYHAHAFRFFVLNTGFAYAILLSAFTVFERVLTGLGLSRYLLALPFFLPALVYRTSVTYERYVDGLLVAAHRPTQLMVLKFSGEAGKVACLWLSIAVFQVQGLGVAGVVYALQLADFPAVLAANAAAYAYVHFRVFRLRFAWWQTFVAPAAATFLTWGAFRLLILVAFDGLLAWNFVAGLVLAVAALVALALVLYFPLTVLLGGWDDNSLRDFRRAREMAGPSKVVVVPLERLVSAAARRARLHGRFEIDDADATLELAELVALRDSNRSRAAVERVGAA